MNTTPDTEKKWYIDKASIQDRLRKALTDVVKNFGYEDRDEASEYMEEYVGLLTDEINDDMKHYLHLNDTSMIGNFADIRYDFEDYKVCSLEECVKLLDAGDTSDMANKCRECLTSWFFQAFGTKAIMYNFGDYIQDALNGDDEN